MLCSAACCGAQRPGHESQTNRIIQVNQPVNYYCAGGENDQRRLAGTASLAVGSPVAGDVEGREAGLGQVGIIQAERAFQDARGGIVRELEREALLPGARVVPKTGG